MIGGLKITEGPWEWRGNQLYSPTARQTLLRDVTFWNCTDGDKAAISKVPDMQAEIERLRFFEERYPVKCKVIEKQDAEIERLTAALQYVADNELEGGAALSEHAAAALHPEQRAATTEAKT